jgi:hypothetical protein
VPVDDSEAPRDAVRNPRNDLGIAPLPTPVDLTQRYQVFRFNNSGGELQLDRKSGQFVGVRASCTVGRQGGRGHPQGLVGSGKAGTIKTSLDVIASASRWSRQAIGLCFVLAALGQVAFAGVPVATPEIDASSLLSGLTLLSGGILILTNRARRKPLT